MKQDHLNNMKDIMGANYKMMLYVKFKQKTTAYLIVSAADINQDTALYLCCLRDI